MGFVCLFGYTNMVSTAVCAQSTPQIQITEINAYGSSQQNGCKSVVVQYGRCAFDKWVELTNVSSNTASLSQYQLSFGAVPTIKNTITFDQDVVIAPHSSVIVAYNEVNFVSASSVPVLDYSGKVLYVSNRETGQIGATLFDAARQVVDTVAIQNPYIESQNSYSFEMLNGEWISATTEFAPHNFGTPGWVPSVVVQPKPVIVSEPAPVLAPAIVQNLAIAAPILIPNISSETVVAPVGEKTIYSLPAILELAIPTAAVTNSVQETATTQLNLASQISTSTLVSALQSENSKVHLEVSWLVAALLIATTRVFVVAFSRKATVFTRQTAMI